MAYEPEIGGKMEEGTFELRCGVTLHLRKVKQTAIRPILLRFGSVNLFEDPEKLHDLEGRALERAIEATGQLFNYCAGWGVTDTAPEEAIAELEEMGFNVSTTRLARINWLRYLCLDGDEEMGSLISAVMSLTYRPEEEQQAQEQAKEFTEKTLADERENVELVAEDLENGS